MLPLGTVFSEPLTSGASSVHHPAPANIRANTSTSIPANFTDPFGTGITLNEPSTSSVGNDGTMVRTSVTNLSRNALQNLAYQDHLRKDPNQVEVGILTRTSAQFVIYEDM